MKALEQQIGGTHYQGYDIQPAEFMARKYPGWLEGNVIKYVCRYQSKGGVEDLEKAQHYLSILIERETA